MLFRNFANKYIEEIKIKYQTNMTTLLYIASVLAMVLNITIIFGAGYFTAYYIQFLKTKHNTNEKSKETIA